MRPAGPFAANPAATHTQKRAMGSRRETPAVGDRVPEGGHAGHDPERHHHVGQRHARHPEVPPGRREDEPGEERRPQAKHPTRQEHRHADASDPGEGGRKHGGQLRHLAAGQGQRGDGPDEQRVFAIRTSPLSRGTSQSPVSIIVRARIA